MASLGDEEEEAGGQTPVWNHAGAGSPVGERAGVNDSFNTPRSLIRSVSRGETESHDSATSRQCSNVRESLNGYDLHDALEQTQDGELDARQLQC